MFTRTIEYDEFSNKNFNDNKWKRQYQNDALLKITYTGFQNDMNT